MIVFDNVLYAVPTAHPTMVCECGMEFIIIAVFRGDDDDKEPSFLHQQSTSFYCPYCGKKGNE